MDHHWGPSGAWVTLSDGAGKRNRGRNESRALRQHSQGQEEVDPVVEVTREPNTAEVLHHHGEQDFSLETASEEELEGRGLLSGAAAGARVRVSRDLSHLGSPGSFPCSSA